MVWPHDQGGWTLDFLLFLLGPGSSLLLHSTRSNTIIIRMRHTQCMVSLYQSSLWGRSDIIKRRESLTFCNSFSTLRAAYIQICKDDITVNIGLGYLLHGYSDANLLFFYKPDVMTPALPLLQPLGGSQIKVKQRRLLTTSRHGQFAW
jgi:hypothetical protein